MHDNNSKKGTSIHAQWNWRPGWQYLSPINELAQMSDELVGYEDRNYRDIVLD